MANKEHLDILKQGREVWNDWRSGDSLRGFDFLEAELREADLRYADLVGINLSNFNLCETDLRGAKLSRANFINANLYKANLAGANLSQAILLYANLHKANLSNANLTKAILVASDLTDAILKNANLQEAYLKETLLLSIDLSQVKGLDAVNHEGPSHIDIHTIYRSHGNIPEVFLRKVGAPDSFIEYMHSLVGKPIDFYSCFISYSNKDQNFANRLYANLQSKGVRCWFAPHDMRIGDKFWHRIDESIRLYDKLLVVLSQHSVESEWVEREVMTALEKERQQKKLVLFPVTVDEAFKQTDAPWAADIRRSRHVGDFRNWKSHDEYQKAFNRLLRDLKAEAQKIGSQDGTTNSG